jgi:phosphate:Na+ symporter
MAEKSMANLRTSLDTICSLDLSTKDEFAHNEEYINFLNKGITKFAVKLAKLDLSENDSKYVSTVFRTVTDLERIGDYAENVMEYAEKLQATESAFSKDAQDEIKRLQAVVEDLYQNTMKLYVNFDQKHFREAYVLEETVDRLTEQMSTMHVIRLAEGTCTAEVGALYLALASNMERVADHFINVVTQAKSLISKSARDELKGLKNIIKSEFEADASNVTVVTDHALNAQENSHSQQD